MSDLILKKGTTLFHGTVEDFPIENIRVGSYDDVLWTVNSSLIAQMYIPVANVTVHTSTSSFLKPKKHEIERKMQEQFGIIYSDIEFDGNQLRSYRIRTPELIEISNKENQLITNAINTEKKVKELDKKITELTELYHKTPTEELNAEIEKYEDEILEALKLEENASDDYRNFNATKLRNEFVNKQLINLGYKPTGGSDYNADYDWKLIEKDNKIMPADYQETGRLLLINPKRDMKIFDISTAESDLTDIQYHKLELFRKLEERGYDGVKIDDFAQSDTQGNYGHRSIGFFSNSIPDLDITEIKNVKHPKKVEWGESDSDEYKEYRKSLNESSDCILEETQYAKPYYSPRWKRVQS